MSLTGTQKVDLHEVCQMPNRIGICYIIVLIVELYGQSAKIKSFYFIILFSLPNISISISLSLSVASFLSLTFSHSLPQPYAINVTPTPLISPFSSTISR